jgi:hypothetical protein
MPFDPVYEIPLVAETAARVSLSARLVEETIKRIAWSLDLIADGPSFPHPLILLSTDSSDGSAETT